MPSLELDSSSPIFIIGVHRSGTTLMRFILSSHRNIYIPPESDFIPRFFLNKPDTELNIQQIQKLLTIIFDHYRFVDEWQGPPPKAESFYDQLTTKTPAGFLNALYGMYAQQNNAKRWGDKTPIYASYVRLIHAIFPNSQFIHMLRDPRDVAVSMLEKYQGREFHVDIYYSARNWVRRIKQARFDSQVFSPNKYLEIHYEELVTNPERTVEKVCRYLGEDFDPVMIKQDMLAREVIPQDSHFFANVRHPINNSSIGRWKEDLAEPDIRLVQHICGSLMQELHYDLSDYGRMPTREIVRLKRMQLKYEGLQSGRRIAQSLGLVPPI